MSRNCLELRSRLCGWSPSAPRRARKIKGSFLARLVQSPYADFERRLDPMSRPQTFIVPQPLPGPSPSKGPREATPFVIVPASFVATDERETLEPHWLPTIDAATD
jgi:hypothetical protein